MKVNKEVVLALIGFATVVVEAYKEIKLAEINQCSGQ